MLIRIKNAQNAGHDSVRVSHSKFKYEIARALVAAGFVGKIDRKGKRIKKILEIELRYINDSPAIHGIALISKPSIRIYKGAKELNAGKKGGIILVSTPKGVMSGVDARKQKVGGMVIAEVW